MDQLQLPFPPVPTGPKTRFQAGDIARVRAPGQDEAEERGHFWQVRFSTTFRAMYTEEIRQKHSDWSAKKVDALAYEKAKPYGDPDIVCCYCRAVPHGTFPGEIQWYNEDELVPTGLSWQVPSWEELHEWFEKDGARSEFVDQINAFPRTGPGEWHHHAYPPLTGEEDLVRLLAGADPFWADFLKNNGTFLFSSAPALRRDSHAPAKAGELPFFA